MKGRSGCDFSFSGLKTAVRCCVDQHGDEPDFVANAAASAQAAMTDILADRTEQALRLLHQENIRVSALVIAGGVAANQAIRQTLTRLTTRHDLDCIAAPPALCTDNGVMVAWAGLERLRLGLKDALTVPARPRWPLEQIKGAYA
jgi:N6-L-threonylcarbamoyladenine synthase